MGVFVSTYIEEKDYMLKTIALIGLSAALALPPGAASAQTQGNRLRFRVTNARRAESVVIL